MARGRRRPWMQRQRGFGTARSAESTSWPGRIHSMTCLQSGRGTVLSRAGRWSRSWCSSTRKCDRSGAYHPFIFKDKGSIKITQCHFLFPGKREETRVRMKRKQGVIPRNEAPSSKTFIESTNCILCILQQSFLPRNGKACRVAKAPRDEHRSETGLSAC